MIFTIVSAVCIVFVMAMLGRISSFFGKQNYPRSSSQLKVKSNYSMASDMTDNRDNSHTSYRNCERATTEPITGDITGNCFIEV